MDEDIEIILTSLRDVGNRSAEARARRTYIEEFRKSKKALLMVQAEKAGITAANAQERYAYAHPEYLELLEGLRQAVEEDGKLYLALERARLKVEVWRTRQANDRAERKGYGMQ